VCLCHCGVQEITPSAHVSLFHFILTLDHLIVSSPSTFPLVPLSTLFPSLLRLLHPSYAEAFPALALSCNKCLLSCVQGDVKAHRALLEAGGRLIDRATPTTPNIQLHAMTTHHRVATDWDRDDGTADDKACVCFGLLMLVRVSSRSPVSHPNCSIFPPTQPSIITCRQCQSVH
jgi:hypothetical protein